ncbi:MAG: prolyl oligopeptidase family serine peptidase [Archangiaceae bacterium]|nr:prolyl oligopeptidase family serine peptidase [Archangiaceae bacterium]
MSKNVQSRVAPAATESTFKGHALQEARELADALKASTGRTVLVPDPASATGFRTLGLEPRHEGGFSIDKEPVSFPPPNPALLAALTGVDRRVTLVPEVHSKSAGRNVRFAVSLPPGYDPAAKGYRVVTLMPAPPPGTTIAQEILSRSLDANLTRFLGKTASDTIVLLPERFEHRFGAMPSAMLEQLGNDVVDKDLLPYVTQHFNTSGDRARYSITMLHQETDGGSVVGSAPRSSGARAPSEGPSSYRFEPQRDTFRVEGSKPKRGFFAKMLGAPSTETTVVVEPIDVVGRKRSIAVMFPPEFDKRDRHAAVRIVYGGENEPRALAKVLGKAVTQGAVVVAVDGPPKTAAARENLEQAIARALSDDGVDLGRMSAQTLSGASSSWVAQVKSGENATPVKLPAPLIATEHGFTQLAPTTDYKLEFPRVPRNAKTSQIPVELQKQSATRGTFFAPVMDSKALGKPVRFGMYLPPGYDPANSEKYPVMVMLPGKGNPLHIWTSAGQLVPKLDKLMAGQAQKMIVVVPDNTDSFWFDYDSNGHPTEGDKGKRNYEGHVMDELLGYVTHELKGDPDRLAIGGISRGGFGAMSLALRHPGRFASVSSTAGVLDLEHSGGVLAKGGAASVKAHFGDADDPVWAQVNPSDLVKQGAFGAQPPRIRIEVGADDKLTARDALAFADLLEQKKIANDFHFYRKPEGELGHNWDSWEPSLEETIAFHQASFGKPGAAAAVPFEDDGAAALKAHQKSIKDRWSAITETATELRTESTAMAGQARRLLGPASSYLTYERSLVYELEGVAEDAPRIAQHAQTLEQGVDGAMPLHAAELVVEKLIDVTDSNRRKLAGVKHFMIGRAPTHAATDPKSFEVLSDFDRKELESAISKVPGLREPLLKLATLRPKVFEETDPLTTVRFSELLNFFVNSETYRETDAPGLAEFVDRMAVRRFDWRRGGYSHSVCTAMNTVYNHPGLILDLVMAARSDEHYPVSAVHDKDGARSLRPLGDLQAGFSEVEKTGWGKDTLPPAQLGYERGLLRAIVDELASEPKNLPPERFASLCDPVAVGLSKLIGQEVRYGYAFNIKTGDDLVAAVKSQGDDGLAFADIEISSPEHGPVHLHFPVFYDYDEKTRTVAMQEWQRGERRISVDGLKFADKGDARPAIFYRPHPDLERFLTPEYQKNWKVLSKARETAAEEGNSSDLI